MTELASPYETSKHVKRKKKNHGIMLISRERILAFTGICAAWRVQPQLETQQLLNQQNEWPQPGKVNTEPPSHFPLGYVKQKDGLMFTY